MSLSQIIKTSILLLILGLPISTQGKTLTWQEKEWDINIIPSSRISQPYIRNDFNVLEITKNSLFGTKTLNSHRLLDSTSARQIIAIASEVNQPTENAELEIQNGRAHKFNPGQNGQLLDLYELVKLVQTSAVRLELPVMVSEPAIKLGDLNDLGIDELIATGESNFTGSPRNRILNINVGAAKFDGLIIQPGEEFSFNTFLGDVDAENGFLPELVIKPDGVIPEFGGGLCQVSSTAFRAAMNAGLPITARRNHSFAVQYYAPQGTDATIYPGSQDFKFINNLSSSLLIRTRVEDRKLFFDYYGTRDDRAVTFEGPYQFDKKPDGSMKATWTRHVTINNTTTTQTFNSKYLPPALFHPVAKEEPSTPNPQSPAEETPSTDEVTPVTILTQ